MRSLAPFASVAALALVACAPRARDVPAASSPPATATPRATGAPRELFQFRADLWANLHQVLFHESLLPKPGFEGPKSLAHESVAPAAALPASEAATWRAAVAYYGAHFGSHDTFAPAFEGLTRSMTANGSADALPIAGLPEDLRAPLTEAEVIYRARFWADHLRRDQAYIAALQPLIAVHGDAMARRLEAIYETAWPREPVLVEVAPVAPPFGATTSGEPPFTGEHAPLVTVSSEDRGYSVAETGLEMIFHEASHLLVGKVQDGLEASAKRQGRTLPRGLWHDLLFYTAGRVARERLGPAYVPYAERGPRPIFSGRSAEHLRIFERAWQPYLDGRVTLDAAIDAVVAAM